MIVLVCRMVRALCLHGGCRAGSSPGAPRHVKGCCPTSQGLSSGLETAAKVGTPSVLVNGLRAFSPGGHSDPLIRDVRSAARSLTSWRRDAPRPRHRSRGTMPVDLAPVHRRRPLRRRRAPADVASSRRHRAPARAPLGASLPARRRSRRRSSPRSSPPRSPPRRARTCSSGASSPSATTNAGRHCRRSRATRRTSRRRPLLLVWLVDLGRAHAIAAAHDAPDRGGGLPRDGRRRVRRRRPRRAERGARRRVARPGHRVHRRAAQPSRARWPSCCTCRSTCSPRSGSSSAGPTSARTPGSSRACRRRRCCTTRSTTTPSTPTRSPTTRSASATSTPSEGLSHSWVERVLARLSGPAALNGRDQLRSHLEAQGFPLR